MDSLSQIALGAAVGVAVMGRRTAVWKSAAWGAVAGTLPDLDVRIDHGDPILNMVLHRAETHAPFWLSLFALPFGVAVAWLSGQRTLWRRWVLAMWAALVTHPLLDGMTVYGTQLGLPFTNHPYGVGSVFIIDPAYTLPLLVGTVWAMASAGTRRGLAANAAGLVLSTAYLGWGVWAQQHVAGVARAALAAQDIVAERLLVTPAPLNTLLWRVVAVQGDSYHEGFRSLLDRGPAMVFDRFDRGAALWPAVQGHDGAQRIVAFSHGFWALGEQDGRFHITDLRMGQEPTYVFRFALARREGDAWVPLPVVQQVGMRPDVGRAWGWLWRRALGQPVPPPR
ncbi:MAG: metal-dependent hydrolase [Ideonella sp.]|nr:metal-dependent hydrolase [Ideonella sp.]